MSARSLDVGLWEPSIAMRRCRADTARAFGITPWALVGPDRTDAICRARFAAAWVLKARWPRLSLAQLGSIIGLGDHSTVFHALRRGDQLRAADMVFHYLTEALLRGHPFPPAERERPMRAFRADPEVAARRAAEEAEWRELLRPERCLNANHFNGKPQLSAAELSERRLDAARRREAHVAHWMAREASARRTPARAAAARN